ncbi:hypothetical protein [Actinomadura violacea]|uniref:Uncharacterized protein n=1 Tax=Actinomadura violacea TaxID=2819934 RepID=A0ABS3RRH9_9ACTN|nr:hypothetical protein [Actinomadura violacea]MBO2459360.1 hypothetical protein [Actinomadura violacea]
MDAVSWLDWVPAACTWIGLLIIARVWHVQDRRLRRMDHELIEVWSLLALMRRDQQKRDAPAGIRGVPHNENPSEGATP